MDYSFNGEIAEMYGLPEATFIHNIYWWIAKNEANGRHHYEGRTWTYNSMGAFAKLFPFWTEKQVRRIIDKLKAAGAIHVGNFNSVSFDRTQWYALSEEVLAIYASGQGGRVHLPEKSHPFARTGGPIPDIKPDSKHIPPIMSPTDDAEAFSEFWSCYPRKVAKQAAQKAYAKLKPNDELQAKILAALEQHKKSPDWVRDNGAFVPHPATWLNGRRWEDELEQQQAPETPRAAEPPRGHFETIENEYGWTETVWVLDKEQ